MLILKHKAINNSKNMSHDIEADYKEEYYNEDKQCPFCKCYEDGFCSELEMEVPSTAHCDFFSSQD